MASASRRQLQRKLGELERRRGIASLNRPVVAPASAPSAAAASCDVPRAQDVAPARPRPARPAASARWAARRSSGVAMSTTAAARSGWLNADGSRRGRARRRRRRSQASRAPVGVLERSGVPRAQGREAPPGSHAGSRRMRFAVSRVTSFGRRDGAAGFTGPTASAPVPSRARSTGFRRRRVQIRTSVVLAERAHRFARPRCREAPRG